MERSFLVENEMYANTVDPLQMLYLHEGFYTCPKGANGERLGPLVGYAGTYDAKNGTQNHWVGDVYVNFAKAEEYPKILCNFAYSLRAVIEPLIDTTSVFCGTPIGGYSFSQILGMVYDRRVIKAEKKVVAPTPVESIVGAREQSSLIFARHEIKPGENVVIVEDVCNNFSTTEELITLIEKSDAVVVGIICLLNRSLAVDAIYASHEKEIPVVSLVRLPIRQYKQDDQEVAQDIAMGNVVWKPKNEWPRLMEAMKNAQKA